jgi:DNA-binding beta-propeller fold protein YncE
LGTGRSSSEQRSSTWPPGGRPPWRRRRSVAVLAAIGLGVGGGLFGGATAGAAVTPAVIASIPMGYDPVAVAVDPSIEAVYVVNEGVLNPNSQGLSPSPGSVSVISGSGSHAVTATITAGIENPTAVAVDPSTHDVFVVNGTSVAVIGGSRNAGHDKIIATLHIGAVTAMAVDPWSHHLYLLDGASVSVFHIGAVARHDRLIATIPVDAGAAAIAVDSSTHDIYVANIDDTVSVIDGSNGVDQVTATIPLKAPGNRPALAVDPSTHTVYVANIYFGDNGTGGETVTVIDQSGHDRPQTVIPIGGQYPGFELTVAVDPSTHAVYVADSNGLLSVIHGAVGLHRNQVVATLPTFETLRDVSVDPLTHDVYAPAFSFTAQNQDSLLVISNANADVALRLAGPTAAAIGTTFTERVTVTDYGPDSAPSVSTALLIPTGLLVTSAPGAQGGVQSNPLEWTDAALAPGASITHLVTFSVNSYGTPPLGGIAVGSVNDPDPANNAAITTIRLG